VRQVVGLILLAALQRRRRGIHISTMLRPDQVPTGATLRELRAARGTSLDLTSHLEVRAGGGKSPLLWQLVLAHAVSCSKVGQSCTRPAVLSWLAAPAERARSDHALHVQCAQTFQPHAESSTMAPAWLHASIAQQLVCLAHVWRHLMDNAGRCVLQGHLERMLTSNASDIGAMLAGVREHHDTLVSALEGEPAAAASLADSGVLNALQVSSQHRCEYIETCSRCWDQLLGCKAGSAYPQWSLASRWAATANSADRLSPAWMRLASFAVSSTAIHAVNAIQSIQCCT
jgi:hypothetical protein